MKPKYSQKIITGNPLYDDALKDGCTIDELTKITAMIPKNRPLASTNMSVIFNLEQGTIREVFPISDGHEKDPE